MKLDVDITVLDNDGSGGLLESWSYHFIHPPLTVLAAAVVCSSLALASAGVEMVDLPAACAVVCVLN